MMYHVFCRYANGDIICVGSEVAENLKEQEEILHEWEEIAESEGIMGCQFWLVPYEN